MVCGFSSHFLSPSHYTIYSIIFVHITNRYSYTVTSKSSHYESFPALVRVTKRIFHLACTLLQLAANSVASERHVLQSDYRNFEATWYAGNKLLVTLVQLIIGCEISGFRREADENCALLGYYAACSGNSLLTFQDNLSVSVHRADNLATLICRQSRNSGSLNLQQHYGTV